MGFMEMKVVVANPADLTRRRELLFLVDSGAVHAVVPREILEEIGIKPHSVETFSLANGQAIIREVGIAAFEYQGKRGGSDVIFGEPGDSLLLGVLTLESFGLVLDPLRQELKPLMMRM